MARHKVDTSDASPINPYFITLSKIFDLVL